MHSTLSPVAGFDFLCIFIMAADWLLIKIVRHVLCKLRQLWNVMVIASSLVLERFEVFLNYVTSRVKV